MSTTVTALVPKTEGHRQVRAAAEMAAVLPYRVTVTGVNAAAAASPARAGSRSPLVRGRPRLPVRAGGSPCRAASLRSRVVQVTRGGQLLQLAPGVGGIGDHADARPGSAPASSSAMRRASHSLDAEFVSLITSLASTGMATGLLIIGSRTTTAAITQVLPYPVFAGPGADPSWNHDAAHTFFPRLLAKVSSIATTTGSPAGTSSATTSLAAARPRSSAFHRARAKTSAPAHAARAAPGPPRPACRIPSASRSAPGTRWPAR